jgi:hypothetical protein
VVVPFSQIGTASTSSQASCIVWSASSFILYILDKLHSYVVGFLNGNGL